MNPYEKLTDIELVDKFVSSKDKNYFGEIYRRYLKIIYKFVYIRVGDKTITEDIVADTFMVILDVIDNYDRKSKLSTFFCGIALNKIRQHWQKKNQSKSVELEDELFIHEEPTERDEKKQDWLEKNLTLVLGELPEKYRNVLVERFLNQKNIRQTAKELNISEANVRVMQNRAIKMAQQTAQNILNKAI